MIVTHFVIYSILWYCVSNFIFNVLFSYYNINHYLR